MKRSGKCGSVSKKAPKCCGAALPFDGTLEPGTFPTATGFPFTPIYPLGQETRFGTLAVNVSPAGPVPAGATLVIEVLKNGLPVPGASVTYGLPNGILTGIQTVKFNQLYAAGDTIQLLATRTGVFVTPTTIAATVTSR